MRATGSALLPALLLLAPAVAAAPRYDVEVVVFERTGGRDLADERWAPRIMVPRLGERIPARDPGRSGAAIGAAGSDGDAVATGLETGTAPATADGAAVRFDAAGYVDPERLPAGFEPLGPGQRRLGGAVERLERDATYRVLRHLAWRQPALAPGDAVPVRIRTGAPIRVEVPAHRIARPRVPDFDGGVWAHRGDDAAAGAGDRDTTETGATTAEPGEAPDGPGGAAASSGSARDVGPDAGTDPAETGIAVDTPLGTRTMVQQRRTVAVHPLDGTVGLVVSRYLHVHADLFYTTPIVWQRAARPDRARAGGTGDGGTRPDSRHTGLARGPDGRPVVTLPLRQQRRMRSGELHYLDHPALGLLVLVTPHEPESGDGDEAGTAAGTGSPGSSPQ